MYRTWLIFNFNIFYFFYLFRDKKNKKYVINNFDVASLHKRDGIFQILDFRFESIMTVGMGGILQLKKF